MNLSLFKSLHALAAAALVGLFWLWCRRGGITPGRGPGGPGFSAAFLLWTGWTALAMYLGVILYAARKYAHKLRISPEFPGARLPSREEREEARAALERAHAKLSEVRVRILAGELRSARSVRQAARRALAGIGTARLLKAKVRKGPRGGPRFTLTALNREPIGRVAKWMHAHVFYGLAAAGMVWLHGGGRLGSPMAWLLNGLSLVVIGTGVAGILLWTFGPAWLTRRERDLSTEQAFYLREHFARKRAKAARELEETARGEPELAARIPKVLQGFSRLSGEGAAFAAGARELLGSIEQEPAAAPSTCRAKLADLLVLEAQRRNVESEWRSLARVRLCLNAWRAVHVPASILLVLAVLVHVLSVWWY